MIGCNGRRAPLLARLGFCGTIADPPQKAAQAETPDVRDAEWRASSVHICLSAFSRRRHPQSRYCETQSNPRDKRMKVTNKATNEWGRSKSFRCILQDVQDRPGVGTTRSATARYGLKGTWTASACCEYHSRRATWPGHAGRPPLSRIRMEPNTIVRRCGRRVSRSLSKR